MRALLALLLITPALAGCLGGSDDALDPHVTDAASGVSILSPGCDTMRPANVHTYDGRPVETNGPIGVPCLVTTNWESWEPSVGLTSTGTVFLYPTVLDRLPQPYPFPADIAIARSGDEGGDWTLHRSRIGAANYHPTTFDPFIYVDPYTDRLFMEDLVAPNCSNLSFSDDEGETWTDTLGGCLVFDHVSIAAGPPVTSSPDSYPNVVYRCAISFGFTYQASYGTACQKSLDGGMTWQPPGDPAFLFGPDGEPYPPNIPFDPDGCHGGAHHVFVDDRGWVWLPRGWCHDPWVAVSKDEGATWNRYQVHDEPMAGHDAGVGVDANGTVYYFWIGSDQRPYLSISKDDGKTWGAPRDVAPAGIAAASSPNLAPGGVGKVAITYGANLEDDETEGVHAVVTVGYGVDSDAPVFQTVFANSRDEPIDDGPCGNTCPGQSDFITMKIGPDGTPWMSLMDNGALGVARTVGAPSLWDPVDPNGPYPDEVIAS